MPRIGVESCLTDVMRVLDENAVTYTVLAENSITNMNLDHVDIVIVKEQSDVSKNSKDQTVIEARDVRAEEVYEKVRYLL